MATLDTRQLVGIRKQLPKFEAFFLNMFFPAQINFETESIAFDKVTEDVVLAPFVHPMVAGKANRKVGGVTSTFTPAYVKPTDNLTSKQVLKRLPGEDFDGEMSVAQRRALAKADTLSNQEKSITYREEWMAVQAVVNGTVVVEGEDYESQVVDFGRSNANNITLLTAAKWDTVDADTYDPAPIIEGWAALTSGVAGLLIFDTGGWSKFSSFKSVKDAIKRDSGSKSSLELTPQLEKVVQYKGNYGDYICVVYKGKFKKNAGAAEENYMPTGHLVIAPMRGDGVRCYGAIQDAKANDSGIVATSRFPKNWFTDDPCIEWLQTQSAPLMVLPDPDAFVSISLY